MQARVLVVEDVAEMAELISLYLRKDGIDVHAVDSGERALELQHEQPFDLVVLDLNLPGMDGFEVLQQLRGESDIPVVVVSARDADEDIILSLGIGADEFVTKPFSPKVLVARVRAMLRRSRTVDGQEEREESVIRFGPFALDTEAYTLKRDGERVPLSPREFDVLQFLLSNAGKPHTPQQIYSAVWGNQYGEITSVGVYVQRLRRKLEDDPREPEYILTLHGKGYCFEREMLQV